MGNWCCKCRSGMDTGVPVGYNEIAQNQPTSHVSSERRTSNSSSYSKTDAPPLNKLVQKQHLKSSIPAPYNGGAQNHEQSHAIENINCNDCNSLEMDDWMMDVSCVKHYLPNAEDLVRHCGNEFHTAVKKGQSNKIRLLAHSGYNIDINECDCCQLTPLMVSAIYGRIECIFALLECGAKADIKDIRGKTAMDYALENNIEGK